MDDHYSNVNIIIADLQPLMIEGLKSVLKDCYKVVSAVYSLEELELCIKNNSHQILIIDNNLCKNGGFEKIRTITQTFPETGIIIIGDIFSRTELTEFSKTGINNIITIYADKEELLLCIDHVLKKKKYYSDSILDVLMDIRNQKNNLSETAHLTASEIEIIKLIAEGLTNKEIAQRKILSIHTILTHRKNILRKLNLSNVSELIMYSINNGLIDPIDYQI